MRWLVSHLSDQAHVSIHPPWLVAVMWWVELTGGWELVSDQTRDKKKLNPIVDSSERSCSSREAVLCAFNAAWWDWKSSPSFLQIIYWSESHRQTQHCRMSNKSHNSLLSQLLFLHNGVFCAKMEENWPSPGFYYNIEVQTEEFMQWIYAVDCTYWARKCKS